MGRRGKQNPYCYFCYRYPKDLWIFKAILLDILPSHLQFNNLLKLKSFFFIFAGFKAYGQTVFPKLCSGVTDLHKSFSELLG